MNNWTLYQDGRTIGDIGMEGGVILRDEEHAGGARLTLKRGAVYSSVSCSIYGWLEHTRFFGTISDADRDFMMMRYELDKVLEEIQSAGVDSIQCWETISEFVRRFP